MKKATDATTIRSVISTYAEVAGLGTFEAVDPQFLDRFLVACCQRLGIGIDLVIGAIQQAVLSGETQLIDRHFARGFTHITECDAAMNPFISDDWKTIKASVLFARQEDADEDKLDRKSARSPRLRRGS